MRNGKGGDAGSARYEPRDSEVRADTTSPIPDKGFKLQYLAVRDPPTLFLSELSEIQLFKY